MRNEHLRLALVEKFPHLYDAADALKIEYSRLSGIIGGYRKPTQREWRELQRVLGKQKFKAVFGSEKSLTGYTPGYQNETRKA
jgi:hypothetical protein